MLNTSTDASRRVGRVFERLLPKSVWEEFVDRVIEYQPDIVVLVARKMPRLAECIGLDFGPSVTVVSDLAIPFIHRQINGARVAILDDFINVGSTVLRAKKSVQACNPFKTKIFALGARDVGNHNLDDLIECVWNDPLNTEKYLELTKSIPHALQSLPKPYDLEFPIMPCKLRVPFQTTSPVFEWLTNNFGKKHVHFLGNDAYENELSRVTVDIPFYDSGVHKVRLYLDSKSGTCNLAYSIN